jgi:outer membrane lipoprotein-sorting protein
MCDALGLSHSPDLDSPLNPNSTLNPYSTLNLYSKLNLRSAKKLNSTYGETMPMLGKRRLRTTALGALLWLMIMPSGFATPKPSPATADEEQKVAPAVSEADRLLAASDAIRNPHQAFALTTTLVEYRNGKQVDGSTLSIYSKPDKQSGQFHTLIRFDAPARDTGKLMLKHGNDLWFYDPSNQSSIRISPEQRLLGQAANGDVATVNLARDYDANITATETVTDGDRQPRPAHLLALTAKDPSNVTYHHIQLWLDQTNQRPIKAKFFSESDRLLKTAYYRRYRPELGVDRPTETVIIDGLDPKWVTVMRFDAYAWRDVPDAWLQRDYLPRFKPE